MDIPDTCPWVPGFSGGGKFVFQTLELIDTPNNLANQVTLLTVHAVSNGASLREHTKSMSHHGDLWGQIADFWDSFEMINWLH